MSLKDFEERMLEREKVGREKKADEATYKKSIHHSDKSTKVHIEYIGDGYARDNISFEKK